MALILTFLGKGGTGRTTIAIAAAKKFASLGSKVLLASKDSSPALGVLLGNNPGSDPTEIAANLSAVQLNSTTFLEKGWEQVKDLEAEYLRSPLLKNVYGQELGILPGMDAAVALNAIREYDKSNKYDVIIYDGSGDLATLRMLGVPEVMSWYIRRFRQVFLESDLGKAISPFVQPFTSAILNISISPDDITDNEATKRSREILDEGKAAIANPKRFAAFLVTTEDPAAIATAKYLWASAQQVNVTVGGVILNQSELNEDINQDFSPLEVTSVPVRVGDDWQPLLDALPNFRSASQAPQPINIDIPGRQVKVFLPKLDKKQVKLTQYGTEITIEAGDQRRNIILPPPLEGRSVKGAKFQEGYLIISL
ncbi:MAG: ArsA family ATPase [Prochloraceae cyanobacterium]|nr:ArsA family ATPase [Prochloraceae cyanobacterium]